MGEQGEGQESANSPVLVTHSDNHWNIFQETTIVYLSLPAVCIRARSLYH